MHHSISSPISFMQPSLIPHVYLVYREALSSIFSSQVLAPLEELQGVTQNSLAILTPIGHLCRSKYRSQLNQIDARARASGIEVGWIPSPPTRFPNLWSDAFLLRRWLSKRFSREQAFLIRCRNAISTRIAMQALKNYPRARIIYDCRGAEVTDLLQNQGIENTPPSQWTQSERAAVIRMQRSEELSVTESAGVVGISNAMIEYLSQKFPNVPRDKFCVIPCCTRVESYTEAASQREAVRKELSLQDRFVVVYLGSLAWMHLPDQFIRIYKIIRSLIPHAHFLAITTAPARMQAFVQQEGVSPDEVTILSVSPHEVPRLLVACDLGISVLAVNERNRICSPVKVAEYFSAGVPVVISPEQGDYSAAVQEHDLGVVVQLDETNEQLADRLRPLVHQSHDERSSRSKRCLQYALKHLSWQSVTPRLIQWYKSLLSDSPMSH